MGWNTQATIAQQVIVEGPGDGLFIYNGTPAAGNLLYAATSGTLDPSGLNATIPGAFRYLQVSAGLYAAVGTPFSGSTVGVFFYTATSPAGPYGQQAEMAMQTAAGNELLLNASKIVLSTSGGSQASGGLTTDTLTATSTALLQGVITGTGGTSSAPSVISTDSANALGTFSVTGITIAEATYYLLPIGPGGTNMGFISIKGSTSGGGPTAGSTTFGNTMATAYRPATATALPVGSSNASDAFSVSVGTAGGVTLHYPTVAAGHTFSCQQPYDLQ